MPGSSTTPGRVDARFHAPTRVAFRIRNGVGTRDKNLCEAQWLACVLLYRRFAAALTGVCARLEADVVSYSFIVSDLHRLLVAGLPAHCERFWTPSQISKFVRGNLGWTRGETAVARYCVGAKRSSMIFLIDKSGNRENKSTR
jgi:hypothetical protein